MCASIWVLGLNLNPTNQKSGKQESMVENAGSRLQNDILFDGRFFCIRARAFVLRIADNLIYEII